MSEDQELDWGQGAQALFYMLRATKDCVERCGALKVDRDFNEKETQCLKKCSAFHAGSSSTHVRFFHQYAETLHIQ